MATVGELMSRTLHSAAASITISEAATIMAQAKVGSTLVLDGETLVGIFTERDMVRAISSTPDAPADPIQHWMTAQPMTVGPDADAGEALRLMLDGGFRHLPVMEGGRLVGMLSMRDLATAGIGVA